MASSTQSELEAREAEAAEARARLANTLETLASPEAQEAVKGEVLGYVEDYKDKLLKQADHYKNELLHKADAYKGEIMERAEKYKDEALQRARDSSRRTMQNIVDDLSTRAINNPAAVALIGAGVGWRLYKRPPIATLLIGAGTALLMRSPGRSARDDRTSYQAPHHETQPRGYLSGQGTRYGSHAGEDASGSGTTEQMMGRAGDMGEKVRDAGNRVRDAANMAGSRLADTAQRARSMAADSASGWVRTARDNPLLLALAGLVAGAAVARSVRATDTGERLVRDGANVLGRGVREMTSQVGNVAGQAVEKVGDVASAAASTVTDAAETVRSRVTDAAAETLASVGHLGSSESPEKSAPTRRARAETRNRRRQRPAAMGQAGREIMRAAERYPLLFGSLTLIVGAAAGAALRPTAAEDRYVGRASDSVKRRAQQQMAGQLDRVLHAADEVMSSVEHRLSEAAGAAAPRDAEPRGSTQAEGSTARTTAQEDVERTSVVVERQDEVATEVSVTRKPI